MESKNKKEQYDENEINEVEVLKQESGGYGYWKRQGDLEGIEQIKPQIVQNSNKIEENNIKAGSAWNSAGTWEEKHYKKEQIQEYFNKNFAEKQFDGFSIEKINGFNGDVYTFIVRQKPKLSYDCEFKLTIKSKENDDTGEIEFTDVNNHETDSVFHANYKFTNNSLLEKIKKNKKNIDDFIKELFLSFWNIQINKK